jgi:hypothetical protein
MADLNHHHFKIFRRLEDFVSAAIKAAPIDRAVGSDLQITGFWLNEVLRGAW